MLPVRLHCYAAGHVGEVCICSLSLSRSQVWISSPTAPRNVKPWATQTGAGCLLSSRLMDAKLLIIAAICMFPAWTPFQTPRCLKLQKPSLGQSGPSPPLAKRRPFTARWRGRSWMDCCLIHERLTNHHIWVSITYQAVSKCSPWGDQVQHVILLNKNRVQAVLGNKDNSDSWIQAALCSGKMNIFNRKTGFCARTGLSTTIKTILLMLLKTVFKCSSYFLWILLSCTFFEGLNQGRKT